MVSLSIILWINLKEMFNWLQKTFTKVFDVYDKVIKNNIIDVSTS